ncbi:MAG: hypothetical protein R3268_15310 [Acidiferrobacterales bacterium]|nr:hypothetical protein [Acidiferrobacterales bacterium]
MSQSKYDRWVTEMQKIADLAHTVGLLHWDTEVYMPKGGAAFRSRQIATLSGITHELFTSAEMGQRLNALMGDPALDPGQRRNVELTLRDYEREVKLDKDLVEALAAAKSQAFNAWVAARKADDFDQFAPALEALIGLKRREARIRADHGVDPYDALLDLYEPGLRAARLDTLFDEVKAAILPLLAELKPASGTGDFLREHYRHDAQWHSTRVHE